jgi:hypothetical protein
MTIEEMRSWFDMIQDKFNSPYFTDLEFEEFINQGQMNFVNESIFGQFIPSLSQRERGGQITNPSESTQQGLEVIRPLIIPDLAISSNSAGEISESAINTAINTAISKTGQEYIHLLAVTLNDSGTDRICRFVRHNDYVKFKTNSFKKPTARAPLYRLSRNGILLDPTGVKTYKLSVVKKPDNVSLSTPTHCELPSEYHNIVVAYAVQLASIASRDEALAVMLNSGKITNAQ